MEWSEGDRKWDNCNSIINKYIKKKEKKNPNLTPQIFTLFGERTFKDVIELKWGHWGAS